MEGSCRPRPRGPRRANSTSARARAVPARQGSAERRQRLPAAAARSFVMALGYVLGYAFGYAFGFAFGYAFDHGLGHVPLS